MFRKSRVPQKMFTVLALAGLLIAPGAQAQDPSPSPAAAPVPDNPANSRARVTQAMAQLGLMVDESRRQGDMVRLSCSLGMQRRGQEAMELSNTEVGVAGNRAEAGSTRLLAAAKMGALADVLEAMVERARLDCGINQDATSVDITKTEAGETLTIPVWDPTSVAIIPPTLPPVLDPQWLPTTSGVQ